MKRRCEFIKADGLKCKNSAVHDNAFCHTHCSKPESKSEAPEAESIELEFEPHAKRVNMSYSNPIADVDDALRRVMDRLESLEIRMRSKASIKPKMTKEKKAKLLFYHEHKRLDSVVIPLREAFRKMGYPEDAPVPWQVIKRKCDEIFDAMPDNKKNQYHTEAEAAV
jgi:hypothetical protein